MKIVRPIQLPALIDSKHSPLSARPLRSRRLSGGFAVQTTQQAKELRCRHLLIWWLVSELKNYTAEPQHAEPRPNEQHRFGFAVRCAAMAMPRRNVSN